jgi:hypothetical protein
MPFDIPITDVQAYLYYPEHNKIYNKLKLFEYQNLRAFPLPIIPKKYPVVIKPIINLCGMGLHSKKINNYKQLKPYLNSNLFWCEYFEGSHYSWDFIIRDGKILYYVVFEGIKKTFGTFKYWKLININNINIHHYILDFINYYLDDYTGSLNIEIISKDLNNDCNIIEAHLRSGDIKYIPQLNEIIIKNIKNEDIDISNINVNKELYLVPVWIKKDLVKDIKIMKNVLKMIKNIIIPELEKLKDKVIDYEITRLDHPEPDKYKRLLLLVGNDLKFLNKLKNKYSKLILKII